MPHVRFVVCHMSI